MRHRQLGSRAVMYEACSLSHMIFSLMNCIWTVFSFFPETSVPVWPRMAHRSVFGGVRTHVISVPFFGDVHNMCESNGACHSNIVPLS